MALLILLTLLFMLIYGPTQVIWAIIAAAATESAKKRLHWLLYLGGVVIYFIGYALLSDTYPRASVFRPEYDPYSIWFYGCSWALLIYHTIIAIMPAHQKQRPAPADLHQNP